MKISLLPNGELPPGLPTSAYEVDPQSSLTFVEKNRYWNYSLEQVLAQGLNRWQGWWCAAGRDGLHINPDGNTFKGSCKVDGYLGNVYEGPMKFKKDFTFCSKSQCVCGSDMQFRKVKNKDDIFKSYEPVMGEKSENLKSPDLITPHPFKASLAFPISITWDIGRRCNYSCSYCHPSISNNYESHKSLGSLKYAVENIWKNFSDERKIKWIFTGGEPTINPAYLDLVKFIRSRGDLIHTQSNGSRLPDYYSELIEHSLIGFSVHFESLIDEKFLETCQAVIEKKAQNSQASLNWFGIRIMVPPNFTERAVRLHENLMMVPDFKKHCQVFMSPVYEKENPNQLMSYQSEELSLIQKYC